MIVLRHWLEKLDPRLPPHDQWPPLVVLLDCPAGTLLDVGHDHVRKGLADPPDLGGAGKAASNELAERFKLRVLGLFDQDGVLEIHPIVLPPLTADARRLYDNAVRQRRHPFSWQAGVGRNGNDAT